MANGTQSGANDLRFRLRSDLKFSEYAIGVGKQLVIKDPVKLEYFLFEPFESRLLTLLRTPKSVAQLKNEVNETHRSDSISLVAIKEFIQRLVTDNLVVAECTGMGASLFQSNRNRVRNAWIQKIAGVLAIRFRGFDPQSLLDVLNPLTRFFFQPLFLISACGLFFASITAAILNGSLIFESNYFWQNLTQPGLYVLIAMALMLVKVLHEFGHALACRSIGRNCHEMGVLLLAFIPCLYCNVSDVWMEPNKWKRMLVSAAGIYVEMLIAIVCVPLWLFSAEGPLQIFWFAMIVICSVNTVLINGNPLLRYDGYYLLTDWLEIPNLHGTSREAVGRRFGFLSQKNIFEFFRNWSFIEIYGILSGVYRYFVVGVILFAIYTFFEQIELPLFGTLAALVLGVLTFGFAFFSMIKNLRNKVFSLRRNFRALIGLVACGILLFLVSLIPVTTRIHAEGEIASGENNIVYAPENGQIVWHTRVGDYVQESQSIAVVKNNDLELKLIDQRNRVSELEFDLSSESLLRSQGADNQTEVELKKNGLKNARRILDKLHEQKEDLVVRAEKTGQLGKLPEQKLFSDDEISLRRKTSALDYANQGAFVKAGEPIAIVVDSKNQIVNLRVPEKLIDRVAIGQTVKMSISQVSPNTIVGVVTEISFDKHRDNHDPAGDNQTPPKDSFLVTVKLKENSNRAFLGSKITAVVLGDSVPVYLWIWRFVKDNFQIG